MRPMIFVFGSFYSMLIFNHLFHLQVTDCKPLANNNTAQVRYNR